MTPSCLQYEIKGKTHLAKHSSRLLTNAFPLNNLLGRVTNFRTLLDAQGSGIYYVPL